MARTLAAALLAFVLHVDPAWGKSVQVPPDDIRRAVEEAFAEIAPADARLEIRVIPILRATSADFALDVRFPEGVDRAGPRTVPVSCRTEDRSVSRGLVSIVVERTHTVWILRGNAEAGHVLTADDLESREMRFDRPPNRLFRFDPEREWRLTRARTDGRILTELDVTRVPDVEAGQPIVLVSRAGGARVDVTGWARREGFVGERILVHNPVSNSLVTAILVDPNTAEIVSPQARSVEDRRSR